MYQSNPFYGTIPNQRPTRYVTADTYLQQLEADRNNWKTLGHGWALFAVFMPFYIGMNTDSSDDDDSTLNTCLAVQFCILVISFISYMRDEGKFCRKKESSVLGTAFKASLIAVPLLIHHAVKFYS